MRRGKKDREPLAAPSERLCAEWAQLAKTYGDLKSESAALNHSAEEARTDLQTYKNGLRFRERLPIWGDKKKKGELAARKQRWKARITSLGRISLVRDRPGELSRLRTVTSTKVRCYGGDYATILILGYPADGIQPEIGHER